MKHYYFVTLEKRIRFEAEVEVEAESEEEAVEIAMEMESNAAIDDLYLLMDEDHAYMISVEKGEKVNE